MKSKKRWMLIIGFAIVCVLVICFFSSQKAFTNLPAGLKYDVGALPSIADFSTTSYEDYKYYFSPVSTAVLKKDGGEAVIPPDDPRLISLLNFIAYSYSERMIVMEQSYILEDEILSYLSCEDPMLEITFAVSTESENNTLNKTPRVVICGDSFLAFMDTDSPSWVLGDGLFAERFWPYGTLVYDLLGDIYNPKQEIISFEGWGCGYWIDLLEYSGFY